MPMYDFKCPSCSYEFEELVFGGRLPSECPSCGAEGIARKVSACAARVVGGGGAASAPPAGCGGGGQFR